VRTSNGLPAGDVAWTQLPLGAGGYMPHIVFADDGTMYSKVDCGGAYKWNPSLLKWELLTTYSKFPAGYNRWKDMGSDSVTIDGFGAFEIECCPTDANYVLVILAGYLFKSTDGGQNFSRVTSWGRKSALSNSSTQRLTESKIAIDPSDKNTWYVASEDTLWFTTDGGTTMSQVTAIPTAGTAKPNIIVRIDRNSALIGGAGTRHSVVWAYSANNGLYCSTNGGNTWTQVVAEAGRMSWHVRVNQAGVCFYTYRVVATGANGFAKVVRSGSTFTKTELVGANGLTLAPLLLAIHPADDNKMVVMSDGGSVMATVNGGTTWMGQWVNGNYNGHVLGGDVPWIVAEINRRPWLALADAQWHPIDGKLYVTCGIGILRTDFPLTFPSNIRYEVMSKGIESMVAFCAVSVPDGPLLCLNGDRPLFTFFDTDTMVTDYWDSTLTLNKGFDADYAADDHNFLVAHIGTQPNYSTDGGHTWNYFSDTSKFTALGGMIAMNRKNNIVLLPGNNGRPCYTTDGITWNWCTFPSNVPTSGGPGWDFGNELNHHHMVTADKARGAGIFYACNTHGSDATIAGIYESLDGGANWTRVAGFPSYNQNNAAYNGDMLVVPGQSGHLFLAPGDSGPVGTESTGTPLLRSTDQGRTWTAVHGTIQGGAAVSTINESRFSFGKAAPGQTYPSIYVIGWINGTYQMMRSDDNCVTWKILSYPEPINGPSCISGDMNTYGKCYMGWSGHGYQQGKYRSRLVGAA
jgi:xyloglucan-specific exo-beta-1,4-glucanase